MAVVRACPVCGCQQHSPVFTVENFPYFTSPVRKEDKKKILEKYRLEQLSGKLEAVICQECSHIYLRVCASLKILADLYKNYYNYPSALEGNFLPVRDQAFFKIFKNKIGQRLTPGQKCVLEIGCFDGYVLYQLKELGFSVTGCDPSHGALIGRKHGLDIKKRFFKTEDFLKEKLSYDIVIFRHLLEHMPEPVDFLKGLRKILQPKGILVFEVPNVTAYLKNGGTGIFSFQHLQYFSSVSLTRLVREAGLHLKECVEEGDNLIAVVSRGKGAQTISRNTIPSFSQSFKSHFDSKKSQLADLISGVSPDGIVLWGAGGFSAMVLEMYGVPVNRVKCIVDSDQNKWGMEYLKYQTRIASPEVLNEEPHGCLMVSSMYADEIINRLRNDGYKKPVINLSRDIQWIQGQDND